MSECADMTPETMIRAIAASGMDPAALCAPEFLDVHEKTWETWRRAVEYGYPLPAFRGRSKRALRRTYAALCGGGGA